MKFSSFDWWKHAMTPDQLTAEKIREKSAQETLRQINTAKRFQLFQQISPVLELKSDFLNMSSYYYNDVQYKIFEIDNLNVKLITPSHDVDNHLRTFNHLPSA